jgi:lipoprotein NlpI
LKPDDAQLYYTRGVAKHSLGDDKGAIADCTHAIEMKSDFADAYYFRGLVWMLLENTESCCHDLKIAAALGSTQARDASKTFSLCE